MGGCLVRKITPTDGVPASLCMTRVDDLLLAATQIDRANNIGVITKSASGRGTCADTLDKIDSDRPTVDYK